MDPPQTPLSANVAGGEILTTQFAENAGDECHLTPRRQRVASADCYDPSVNSTTTEVNSAQEAQPARPLGMLRPAIARARFDGGGRLTEPISPLIRFLEQFRVVESGSGFTHTSIGFPKASYNIPADQMPQLYKHLYHHIFVLKREVSLTEKPVLPGNIKIDLDFRYEQDLGSDKRPHTIEHIKAAIKVYNGLIRKFLNAPEEQIKAYVFERPSGYVAKGYLRDGVHIMYPYIICAPELQFLFRKELIKVCGEIFGNLPVKNTYDDIVDRAVIADNNWLVYGATKPNIKPYRLVALFDGQLNACPLPSDHLHTMIILSNYYPERDAYSVTVRPERFDELTCFIAEEEESVGRGKGGGGGGGGRKGDKSGGKRRIVESAEAGASLADVRALLKLIKPHRADNYHDWIRMGWCLHNIDHGLLDDWILFSRQSAQFKEGECEALWSEMRDEGYNIGSLHRWARQDNTQAYETFRRGHLAPFIEKSISQSTTDVANVVYQMYKYDYVCVAYKQNVWYEFRQHRWHETDSGVSLRKHLSNEVINEYLRLISFYNQSAIGEKDEHKDQFLVKCKQLTDVTYKLRDQPFKDKIMKECAVMFYDKDFMSSLDTNSYLIGFENGVYDLRHHELRDGRPEDRVSISTGNDFFSYENNDPLVEEIYAFLNQVFPITRVRDYVIYLLSSFLYGGNPDEKFHIWNGGGGNGKSKTIDLFTLAFGNYCAKLPISLLTQKRGASGAASPELARLRGVRFVSLQEPDENDRLNVGQMKEMSGNDTMLVRALYGAPFEFKPQFKMVLCCNNLPKVPPNDDGTWRRIRVVNFIAKFVDNPNPENKYEFAKDTYLSDKLKIWKEAFMYILLEHFASYQTHGIVEPPEVKEATREYQRVSDIFVEFKEECFIPEEGSGVKLEESYKRFKEWYKRNQEGKPPGRNDFRANMEKHLGKYHIRMGWQGWAYTEELTGLEPDPNGRMDNPVPTITPCKPVVGGRVGGNWKGGSGDGGALGELPPPASGEFLKTPVITIKK